MIRLFQIAIILLICMQAALASTVRVNTIETRFGLKVYFENLDGNFDLVFADGIAMLAFKEEIEFQDLRLLANKKSILKSVQLDDSKLTLVLESPNDYIVERFSEEGKQGIIIRTKENQPISESIPKVKVKLSVSLQTKDEDKPIISFHWKNDVGAAAFVRADTYYVVFNYPFELQPLDLKNSKVSIKQLNDNVLALKFSELKSSIQPAFSMYKKDKLWVLDASAQIAKNEVRVFSRPYAAPYPRVELEFLHPNIQEIISFVDPIVGDELYIVTSKDSALNNAGTYKYIDFNVLPSIQGAVIQKISDSIAPTIKDNILAISGAVSLNISAKQLRKSTKKFAEVETNFNLDSVVENSLSILSLRNFILSNEHFAQKFLEIRSTLASTASVDARLRIYSNWALYYLANGLYKEGLVITKLMQQEDPDYSENYNIKLIRGALHFMDGNYFEAQKIFKTIDMIDIPLKLRKEVRFWQTLANYKLSEEVVSLDKVDPAKIYLEDTVNFLSEYPDNFVIQFGLDILGNKIRSQDDKYLLRLFDKLTKLELPAGPLQNRLLNYKAIYLSNNNKQDAAFENWNLCIEDPLDVQNVVICRYEKNAYSYANLMIDKEAYVEELERLALVWKGGNMEMKILNDLGNIYFGKKEYVNALRSWKKIIDKYPFNADSLRLSKLMGKTFIEYFTDSNSNKMNSFEAVTTFYEFENLVPVGADGDELVLRFIDHLIALDLLEKAEELLKHQINFRLEGNAKERAVNRLAKVYILDLRPDLAIEALELGDFYEELPDSIALERKHIHAEAYLQNEETQKALDLIQGDFSPEADDIRVEIFWRLKNWSEFNKNAEPRIYAIRYQNETLNERDLDKVLRLSISYLINNQRDLLTSLISDFKTRVPDSSKKGLLVKSLFDTLSELNDMSLAAFDNLQSIQDKIKNLMDAMRGQ